MLVIALFYCLYPQRADQFPQKYYNDIIIMNIDSDNRL